MMIIVMAWRNIWRNRVRSLIIISSVAVGLIAALFVLSLYKGILSSRVETVIHEEVGHLQIHHPDFREDYDPQFVLAGKDSIERVLGAQPAVLAFARRTICQGMLATGTGSSGVQITGVDAVSENAVSHLERKLVDGAGFSSGKNQVIIGRKLAEKMRLALNSKAILTFTDRESNIVSAAFRVAAIYETDNAPRDETIVFVQRNDLNRLLGLADEYHELAIILKDEPSLIPVRDKLAATFPHLKIETWQQLSPETKLMIDTTDQYSYIFISIIMLALSFGIINSMLMAILERSREIGMLLALGMNRVRVFSMVVSETLFLTLSGVPMGIALSWFLVMFYQRHGIDLSGLGDEAMTSFGFSNIIFPEFPWEKMASEIAIVAGAALMASLFPAAKAVGLRPVEALQK